jgi:hypothetical protein
MGSKEMMVRIDARAGDDTAEFIAILMVAAKCLDHSRNCADLPLEDAVLHELQGLGNLLSLAHRFYPERGEMQRRVIAFADKLGFDVAQHSFAACGSAIH